MGDKVKVRYCGPNADSDPRTMEVSSEEADALTAGGLWKTANKSTSKSASKKAEVSTDG